MAASIVLVTDGCDARRLVARGRRQKSWSARVVHWQGRRDPFQGPGAREIDAVEMRQLAVARVNHFARLQPGVAAIFRNLRQELAEPIGIFARLHHAAHQVRLHETGGKEVFARRLIGQRAIHVRLVELQRLCSDLFAKRRTHRCVGPVQHQTEGKSRLVVRADPDGIEELVEPFRGIGLDQVFER